MKTWYVLARSEKSAWAALALAMDEDDWVGEPYLMGRTVFLTEEEARVQKSIAEGTDCAPNSVWKLFELKTETKELEG
jgi:hypothetical protein